MRGEVCVGFGSVLSLAALLLLIFVHVGQINTSSIPSRIAMVKVNVTGYGQALHSALLDPIEGLYTSNTSAPLEDGQGLRQYYEFGLYSHCGYVAEGEGVCGNHTIGEQFRPYDSLTSDMTANYTTLTQALILDTTFRESDYLGQTSKAAYWMLLFGTICAAATLLTGILKNNLTFFVSTAFAIVGSLFILIGASIWTVLIKKSESLNDILIGSPASPVPIGIIVSVGSGVYLSWAAFACLAVSIVPYMVSCCTFRG